MNKSTKHRLIPAIGAIALCANLLLPGLSFGQSESLTQSISILMECGTYGITLGASSFDLVMRDSDFTSIYAYGSAIGGKTYYQYYSNELPGEATLLVEDYRTEMIGCAEEGVDGWHIDVAPETTNVWDDGHGNTFTPTDFKIVTTTNFDTSASGVDIESTHYIRSDGTLQTSLWWPNAVGSPYNIQLPYNAEESGNLTDPDCFNLEGCTGTSYSDANDISNGSLTFMDNSGGTEMYKPGPFYTGLAFQLVVPSTAIPSDYQYSNTIEFTMVIAD